MKSPSFTEALGRWATAIRRPFVFPLGARIDFYDNMATLRRGNVVTREALASLTEVNATLGRTRQSRFFRQILDRIEAGQPLAVALQGLVPTSELMVLAAGERSDSVDGFVGAGQVARGSRAMIGALFSSATYPAVLLVAAVAMLIGIAKGLLPQMEKMLKGKSIDSWEVEYYLIGVRFIDTHWPICITIALALLVAFVATIARWSGPVRRLFDQYAPPYVLYRLYCCAGFLIALSALTRTHMPVKEAIEHLHASASPYLRTHLRRMLAIIVSGQGEANAFSTGLLPPSIVIRIHALSRAGGVSGALSSTGAEIVTFCVNAMKVAGAVFLGVVLALVGVVILWTLTFFNSLDPGGAITTG